MVSNGPAHEADLSAGTEDNVGTYRVVMCEKQYDIFNFNVLLVRF